MSKSMIPRPTRKEVVAAMKKEWPFWTPEPEAIDRHVEFIDSVIGLVEKRLPNPIMVATPVPAWSKAEEDDWDADAILAKPPDELIKDSIAGQKLNPGDFIGISPDDGKAYRIGRGGKLDLPPSRPTPETPTHGEPAVVPDAEFATGAVRSNDVADMDFCSMPLMGLLGVMKIAGCGGIKYGRFNYMKGFPVHDIVNHAIVHVVLYLNGDRSEDHLSKAAWGLMVANQTAVLNPELASPHLLGPGATITPEVDAELERGKPERDAKRKAGLFESLFNWTLADVAAVKRVLKGRKKC